MKLELSEQLTHSNIFEKVEAYLFELGLEIHCKDLERPWGGFFVLGEAQAEKFAGLFFPEISFDALLWCNQLCPKILMVKPHKKLSWQYHHRRSEIWKSIYQEVGVVSSLTDEQGDVQVMKKGDLIELDQGERHRLIGLDTWGVVAEIWIHADPNNPSNEDDIIRLDDEFGR